MQCYTGGLISAQRSSLEGSRKIFELVYRGPDLRFFAE